MSTKSFLNTFKTGGKIAYMGQDISKFLLLEKELQSLNPDENLSELTDKINEASSIAGKITGTLSALAEDPKFFTSYVFTQVNIPPLGKVMLKEGINAFQQGLDRITKLGE